MRIVHLADLHLGYRAYNKLDKNGTNIREKDLLKAFNESLDKIAKINPDLIIMAGDIFHRPRPSNLTIYTTLILLNKFRKTCSAPIVMIAGNHEAYKTLDSGSVLRIFDNTIADVHVIDNNIEQLTIKELDTSVLCVPHGGISNMKSFALRPDDKYKYNIMTIHGTYENCPEIAGYSHGSLIKEEVLNRKDWDYIAFGHYHKFTELAPNCYYSGAIERTTTNIWQEANDDKGFIEFDLDSKVCTFHKLENRRKVYDIKRIDADNLTAEEIDEAMAKEISKIKDFDKSIVKIVIENADTVAIKGLDYKKIRDYKKDALHFRLNVIKKDAVNGMNSQEEGSKKKKMEELIQEESLLFELSQGIDRKRFSNLAQQYIQEEIVL